jgi:protein ImuA
LAVGFHELIGQGPGHHHAVLGFALSMAAKASAGPDQRLCVCSLASEAQEHGVLYGHGLAQMGVDPSKLLIMTCRCEKDLLWTLEEAVSSGAFGGVLGTLGQAERLYAFPQSRRLKLRVAASGTPLFLLRHWRSGGATAAHGRWRIAARPSISQGKHGHDNLLGPPRMQLSLERMAGIRPQSWELEYDGARGFHLVSALEDRPSGGERKPGRQAA